MNDDDVVIGSGVIQDVVDDHPLDGPKIADALRRRLNTSAFWRPASVTPDLRGEAATGTRLPRWQQAEPISDGTAEVIAGALAEVVPADSRYVRVQVDTNDELSELRRVRTFDGALIVPSFPSRGSRSRPLQWRWPMRVGIVLTGRSMSWLTEVQASWHHGTVYDAEILAPHAEYEIAIVHQDDVRELDDTTFEQLRATTCVIAVGDGAAIDAMHDLEDGIAPVIAIGIAAPPEAWWIDFFESLTHDLPVDVAVSELVQRLSIDAEIAGPAIGMDVTAAARWFAHVAPDHPAMAAALDEFADWDWSSEGGGSTNTRHLVDEARAAGGDPRAVVSPPRSGQRPGSAGRGPAEPLPPPPMAAPAPSPPAGAPAVPRMVAPDNTGETGRPQTAVDDDPDPDSPPAGRFVHAVVVTDEGERKTFVADRANRLRCWIGPDRGEFASVASEASPEVGRDVQLDVELRVRSAVVARDTIFLPAREGARSSDSDLELPSLAGKSFFNFELAFLLDGRMFELVEVVGRVVESGSGDDGDELQLDSVIERRDLLAFSERAPSAGVLDVIEQDGEVVVREFGSGARGAYDLSGSMSLVEKLTGALYATEVSLVRKQQQGAVGFAAISDDIDPDWTGVLRTMARHGWMLFDALRSQGFEVPGDRFEIINRLANAYVPVEFVYDRGFPTADATMDPACLDALRRGDDDCGRCNGVDDLTDQERDGNPRICPYGFWSLSKVIERQDADEHGRLTGTPMLTDAVNRLRRVDSVLTGWSSRLRDDDADALPGRLGSDGRSVSAVSTWAEWKAGLADRPSVLLALPHHDEEGVDGVPTLEIGDSTLELGQALDQYVTTPAGAPEPILVLLGCETNTAGGLGHPSFAQKFSPHASVVVGTLSKVLGRHAVPFAHRLIEALVEAQVDGGDVGTVMRDVRRRMFADGYLMALGVIALGDAGWRLAGEDVA